MTTNPSSASASPAERGFTIIELIVASAMMVVITGAAVAMMVSALHSQPSVTNRADQIGTARNALEKLTVDLRQGSEVTEWSPRSLALATYCDPSGGGEAAPCTVSYECAQVPAASTFQCTRQVNAEAPKPFITGLASDEVFCVVPSVEGAECGDEAIGIPPTYVGVSVQLPASDRGAVTVLEGGAALHNFTGGEGA